MFLAPMAAAAAVSVAFMPSMASAQMPFGGTVTATLPCDSGLLLYLLVPLQGVETFMWSAGELPYMMHVVPHIGQELLGMAFPVEEPCVVGMLTVGSGFPIIYHGSSL